MSDLVFGRGYAGQYDLLYYDKDYKAECDLLEEVFRRYAKGPVQTILDLGCGTGSHAIPLAERGYQVAGVDRSTEMLACARRKTEESAEPAAHIPPTFLEGDLRSVDLGKRFDAVLMMFAVLGYQLTNEDVLSGLRTVRRHLKAGGLFVCDVWYGPAVLAIGLSDRVKIIPTGDGEVIRVAAGTLDVYHHLAEVHYRLWRLRGQQVLDEAEESHKVRYFFPQELRLFLSHERLTLLDMRAFGDLERSPGVDTWNVLLIGEAA